MTNGETARPALMPEVALILAILLPGVGQFYNGQFWKGLLIAITSFLIIPWIWGMYDAFTVSKRINAGEIESPRAGCLFAFLGFVLLLVITFVVVFGAIVVLAMLGVTLPPELVEQVERLAQ